MADWISVKDRMPPAYEPVLVAVPFNEEYVRYVGLAYYTTNGGYWCGTDGSLYGEVGMIPAPTHWMELPKLPKEEDDA